MLASELVELLQQEIEEHGDLDVVVMHGGDGSVQFCDEPVVSLREEVVCSSDEVATVDDPGTSHVVVFLWNF